jgi:hypothetical protein
LKFEQLSLLVAAKNGAILAGLWRCFRWGQPLPAFFAQRAADSLLDLSFER